MWAWILALAIIAAIAVLGAYFFAKAWELVDTMLERYDEEQRYD